MDSEQVQDLSKLPLKQILQMEDMILQQLLAIRQIHTKIKLSMKVFIQYCQKHEEFTDRLISLGLKCPMHQSNNQQMKQLTYIAADVLTCDHQTLADLFILPTRKTAKEQEEMGNQEEIQEEIETEEVSVGSVPQEQKYKYLIKMIEYFKMQPLDENCLNYISKALLTLVRKKISQFLQFFMVHPEYFSKMIQIAHYPAISHLLAKMLTDDDDGLTVRAMELKKKIIPGLLSKLHQEIDQKSSLEILQGLEDIINSSRYSDNEEPSQLQKMSNQLVSHKEASFFIQTVVSSLQAQHKTQSHLYALQNATTYLTHLLNRIIMDEQQDFMYNNTPQEFKPTLQYQLDQIFVTFCKLVSKLYRIWEFKEVAGKNFGVLPIKTIEPLVLMTKHSKFSSLYAMIEIKQRSLALQALLKMTCATRISGVLLQNSTQLIEKMLNQQEKMAQEEREIVAPQELYLSIEKYSGAIGTSIAVVLEENRNQRNKNQNGIYFRKILLLFDNYFKNKAVLKKHPKTAKVQELFPQFNHTHCKLYAQKAAVLDHPGGAKVQPVEEFKFLNKNLNLIRSNSPEIGQGEKLKYPMPAQVAKEEEKKLPKDLVFNLPSKMKALKQRVKQKNPDKDQASSQTGQAATSQVQSPNSKNSAKQRESPSKQSVQVESPTKSTNEKSGLSFFVRHLMIY